MHYTEGMAEKQVFGEFGKKLTSRRVLSKLDKLGV